MLPRQNQGNSSGRPTSITQAQHFAPLLPTRKVEELLQTSKAKLLGAFFESAIAAELQERALHLNVWSENIYLKFLALLLKHFAGRT